MHIDTLRKLTKDIQEARQEGDAESMKSGLQKFDEYLEKLVPILMAQAKIYWNKKNFAAVEKLFR